MGLAGFSGIYLDRRGYEDNGLALETDLSNTLEVKPLLSRNGRLAFFSMMNYYNGLRDKNPKGDWRTKEARSTDSLSVKWLPGFYDLEAGLEKDWRWCSSKGELHLENKTRQEKDVRLEMRFATGNERSGDLMIRGPFFSDHLKIGASPQLYSKTIKVPPGNYVLKFVCGAKQVDAPFDPRVLVFRIEDFRLTELE